MLKTTKDLIRWMIIAVVAIDLLLAGVNWRMAASGRAPKNQLAMLRREHALMAADLARAQRIQQALPAVEQQCDTFFKQNLRPGGLRLLIAGFRSRHARAARGIARG